MGDHKNKQKTEISDSIFQKLQEEKIRTGYGASKLLSGRKDIPKGLHSGIINTWLRQSVKTARPRHLEYVLQQYAELPSGNSEQHKKKFKTIARRKEGENYVPINRQLIRSQMKRTGLRITDILALLVDQGSDLTFPKISKIAQGAQRKAYKPDYEAVIKFLSNAPDYEPPPLKPVKQAKHKLQDGYIALTPSIMKKLQFYRSKQLLPHGIFKDIPYAPENPKPRNVMVWFSGKHASIRKSDWEFIEHHCEKALESMRQQP